MISRFGRVAPHAASLHKAACHQRITATLHGHIHCPQLSIQAEASSESLEHRRDGRLEKLNFNLRRVFTSHLDYITPARINCRRINRRHRDAALNCRVCSSKPELMYKFSSPRLLVMVNWLLLCNEQVLFHISVYSEFAIKPSCTPLITPLLPPLPLLYTYS